MADIIINGTTLDGTPERPVKVSMDLDKIGRQLRGKDGTLTWMHRGFKRTFTVAWEKINVTTLAFARTTRLLTTSFTYTSEHGTPYTVLCSGEDRYTEEFAFTDAAGNNYYNVSLIMREV